jgi:DNA processing protein
MNKDFSLGFSIAPGIGPKTFQKLLVLLGSEKAAWEADNEDFKKAGAGTVNFLKFDKFRKSFNHTVYFQKMTRAKIDYVPFGEKYYPESLMQIEDPPIGLFIKGNKKILSEDLKIAVVGARKITSYGEQVTESLVRELCSHGFTIVSGMALGIDAIAHKSAIENRGMTVAILGCGVDCPFPRENERLYEEILDSGGSIISEYPLGMPPNQGTFPARNRIIAGLCKAVLVTEAAEDSGSLITAEHAVRQKKPVFAVPGPITSRTSIGTLKLIKQGAVIAISAEDILKELEIKNQKSNLKTIIQNLKLSEDEEKIYKALQDEELTIDEISNSTKIKADKLSSMLSEMELNGVIRSSGGIFTRKS